MENWDIFADIVYPAFLCARDEAGLGGGGVAENLLSFPFLQDRRAVSAGSSILSFSSEVACF